MRRLGLVALALLVVGGASFAFLRSGLAERWATAVHRDLVAASVQAGFVVERVYSEGRSLADEAALTRVLKSQHEEPIFTVELEKLKEQVEALPWVRSASVGRRLPDTIWVRLDEHRPVARWMDGTRQVLVSDAQEVFKVKNAARYRDLPLLFGRGAPASLRWTCCSWWPASRISPATSPVPAWLEAVAGTSTWTAASRSGFPPPVPRQPGVGWRASRRTRASSLGR